MKIIDTPALSGRGRTAPASRHRRVTWKSGAASCALIATCIAVSGCEKLSTSGTGDTMALLHSGSEKVCVATDVQKTLHDLIVPAAEEIAPFGNEPAEDKRQAVNSVSLSYDLTTLQSFDKDVSKAVCNSTVTITVGNASSKHQIEYVVSPSSENPNSFIVTAQTREAKSSAKTLAEQALQGISDARQAQQADAQAQQAKAQLIATVTPAWLVGTWIGAAEDGSTCSSEQAFTLTVNRAFKFADTKGRWQLSEDQLHLVGNSANGAQDKTMTLTAADSVSFNATSDEGVALAWRRCTQDEVSGPPEGLPDEPENSG